MKLRSFIFGLFLALFFSWSPTIMAREIAQAAQDSLHAVINAAKRELAFMELQLQQAEKDLHGMKIECHGLERAMKGETQPSKTRQKSPRSKVKFIRPCT